MDKKEQNIKFFNKWANCNYDWAPFQWWMTRFQKPIEEEVQKSNPKSFLDISCGTGKLLSKLVILSPKTKYTGLDISPEMLKKAKQRLPKNVTLKQGDVHQLPFKDNSFNLVVSTESFHHYDDQKKALEEMKRITTKGGKVMVVDINFFFKIIHKLFETFEPGCVKVNNKREMISLFQNAGLKDINQKRSFLFAVMTSGTKGI